jgi:hypothetical protein
MKRYLHEALLEDLGDKIILLTGPRQCGKTTLSRMLVSDYQYINYDLAEHRLLLREKSWDRRKPLVIFPRPSPFLAASALSRPGISWPICHSGNPGKRFFSNRRTLMTKLATTRMSSKGQVVIPEVSGRTACKPRCR